MAEATLPDAGFVLRAWKGMTMDNRIILDRGKKLWRGRNCHHEGCTSNAVTQCDAFVGDAFDGNLCAAPLCTYHRHQYQQNDYCDAHRVQHQHYQPINATQTSLLSF